MRRLFAIALLHIKLTFRSPSAWVLMFVMPIIFSLIFGGMATGSERAKPLIAIAGGGDPVAEEAMELLMSNEQYSWKRVSEKEAALLVEDQEAIAGIVISSGLHERVLSEEPVFDVIIQRETQEYASLYPYLEGTARSLITSGALAASIGEGSFPVMLSEINANKGINVEKEIIQKEGKASQDVSLISIGFTLMFMMFGISGAAGTILEERAGGTWPRLLTTPALRGQIIGGYVISYFLMGWIQLGVMMAAISIIYGGTWGNPLWLIPYASLVILCIAGFGLMIAGIVKTKQQAGVLSTILIVSTSMLGGLYWSLDFVPDTMKLISKFVPQSWMMSGIREIVSGSLHSGTIWTSVLALAGFSVIFYYLGLRKMKY